jgi:hypothetical protein
LCVGESRFGSVLPPLISQLQPGVTLSADSAFARLHAKCKRVFLLCAAVGLVLQQARSLPLDDCIALADPGLQARPVEHLDLAA